MGYRSDVGIKCQPMAFNALKEVCEQHNILPDKILFDGDAKEYLMYWEYVKWYEGIYEDVDAIMELLNWLDVYKTVIL